MSHWTHITSCISVDTCIEEKNVVKLVKQHLKKAPQITGNEENAVVYVNKVPGYNCGTNWDCKHCEYGHTVVHLEEGGFQCDASADYICPEAKFQTCVVISIQGDLRDREYKQTKKEFDAFLKYLEAKYIIRDYSLNIEGE